MELNQICIDKVGNKITIIIINIVIPKYSIMPMILDDMDINFYDRICKSALSADASEMTQAESVISLPRAYFFTA